MRLWFAHATRPLVELFAICEGLPIASVGHLAHDGLHECVYVELRREATVEEAMRARIALEEQLGLKFVRSE